MKNPFVKLALGAILLGVGFVVSMGAQRELIAKWGAPCEDCDEELEEMVAAETSAVEEPEDEVTE